MDELLNFLSAKHSIPTFWLIAGALLLVAAGGRSAWPAIAAAVLIAGYYLMVFLGTR